MIFFIDDEPIEIKYKANSLGLNENDYLTLKDYSGYLEYDDFSDLSPNDLTAEKIMKFVRGKTKDSDRNNIIFIDINFTHSTDSGLVMPKFGDVLMNGNENARQRYLQYNERHTEKINISDDFGLILLDELLEYLETQQNKSDNIFYYVSMFTSTLDVRREESIRNKILEDPLSIKRKIYLLHPQLLKDASDRLYKKYSEDLQNLPKWPYSYWELPRIDSENKYPISRQDIFEKVIDSLIKNKRNFGSDIIADDADITNFPEKIREHFNNESDLFISILKTLDVWKYFNNSDNINYLQSEFCNRKKINTIIRDFLKNNYPDEYMEILDKKFGNCENFQNIPCSAIKFDLIINEILNESVGEDCRKNNIEKIIITVDFFIKNDLPVLRLLWANIFLADKEINADRFVNKSGNNFSGGAARLYKECQAEIFDKCIYGFSLKGKLDIKISDDYTISKPKNWSLSFADFSNDYNNEASYIKEKIKDLETRNLFFYYFEFPIILKD